MNKEINRIIAQFPHVDDVDVEEEVNVIEAGFNNLEDFRFIRQIKDKFENFITHFEQHDDLDQRLNNVRRTFVMVQLYKKANSTSIYDFIVEMDDEERNIAIEKYSKLWNIEPDKYIDSFIDKLGQHIGRMHNEGFINNSLCITNVNLLGEIIDYETVILTNDTQDNIEQRGNEIFNAISLVIQLKMALSQTTDFYEIYYKLMNGYEKQNQNVISLDVIKSIGNKKAEERMKAQQRGVKKIRGAK